MSSGIFYAHCRLKRRRTVNAQRNARFRIAEFDLAGMQHQAPRLDARSRRSVEVVAEYGMSHGLHVHPQLMRTPGDGIELDVRNRARSVDVDDAITRQAWP